MTKFFVYILNKLCPAGYTIVEQGTVAFEYMRGYSDAKELYKKVDYSG